MGSTNNKCSCFNSKDDNETAKLDKSIQNNKIDSSSNKNSFARGSNPEQVTLKNLKSYVTFRNLDNSLSQQAEDSSSGNNNVLFDTGSKDPKQNKKHANVLVFQGENNTNDKSQNDSPEKNGIINNGNKEPFFSLGSRKSSNSDKESDKEKVLNLSKKKINGSDTKEEEKNNKDDKKYNALLVIRIQKVYKGFIYRKNKYPKQKQKLILQLEEKVKDLYNEYLTSNLKKQEASLGLKQNETSYKSLYSNSSSIGIGSAFVGGLRLYTKLLILKYNNIPSFYVGEVNINNELNGKGILMQKDGCKYNGTFENNIFTGVGRYIDKEGTLYEGYFTNGNLEGRATKKMLNGCLYIGDFVNGVREGKGKEETKELVYEGQFSKDKKNGKGKLIYKLLNDSYEGDFVDNLITGEGKYKWTNGETYEGSFVNGKMHGRGIYRWPDGGVYEGEYINNIKEGKGVFKWANGKIFDGEFKKGKPSGPGFLTVRDKKFKVIFKDGKLEGKLEDLSSKGQRIDEEDENDNEEEESDCEGKNSNEEEEVEDIKESKKKKQKKKKKVIEEEDEKQITEEDEENNDEDSQSFSPKRTISYAKNSKQEEPKGKSKKKNKNIIELDSNVSDSFNRENSNGSTKKNGLKSKKVQKDISISIDESKEEESQQSLPKKKTSLSKNNQKKLIRKKPIRK